MRVVIIITAIVCAVLVTGSIGISMVMRRVTKSGITGPIDEKFGDQHLKTAVALLELHKVRYGRYPPTLQDLRFTSEWDVFSLQGMRYIVSPDGTKYYVEVERGWMGKPSLSYPPEFWQGTGYSPELKPQQ